MSDKIDISSTTLEKGLDIAKEFLDKLVTPAAEELGFLLRDSVALWKLQNQVRVLTKAKAYCERHNISPQSVSLKLLCPLLEHAALEEEETLQDKWAILLSNMVDSEQNVQNHVFPYILSQISTNEFFFLEQVYREKVRGVREGSSELEQFRNEKLVAEPDLLGSIAEFDSQLQAIKRQNVEKGGLQRSPEYWEVFAQKHARERELHSLRREEQSLTFKIKRLEVVPYDEIEDFEISNVVRLGLVRWIYETELHSAPLDIPFDSQRDSVSVDVEIELESSDSCVLTQLGELFF